MTTHQLNYMNLHSVYECLRVISNRFLDQKIGKKMRRTMAHWLMDSFKNDFFSFETEQDFLNSKFYEDLKKDLEVLRPAIAFNTLNYYAFSYTILDHYHVLALAGFFPEDAEDPLHPDKTTLHKDVCAYIDSQKDSYKRVLEHNQLYKFNDNGDTTYVIYVLGSPDSYEKRYGVSQDQIKKVTGEGSFTRMNDVLKSRVTYTDFNGSLSALQKALPEHAIAVKRIHFSKVWINRDIEADLSAARLGQSKSKRSEFNKTIAKLHLPDEPPVRIKRRAPVSKPRRP